MDALLDALQGLRWPARRRARGTRTGAHVAALRGRSPEVAEWREYRPGDDARDVDWKLFARRDRAWVRLTEDRAIHATWFLIDGSASMAYPAGAGNKWNAARGIVRGLAHLAARAGDPVGASVAIGDGVRTFPLSTRPDALLDLDTALATLAPHGTGPLSGARAVAPAVARVVLVTDLLGDATVLRATLAGVDDLVVLHLLSPDEWRPPEGRVRDPEAPALERTLSPATRDAYARALRSWADAEGQAWRGMGAAFHPVDTSAALAEVIRGVVARTASDR